MEGKRERQNFHSLTPSLDCRVSLSASFTRAFKLDFVGEHVCNLKRSPNTPFHVTALPPAARSSLPSAPSLGRSAVGGSLESENGLAFSGAQPSDQSRPPCCFNNILACTKWMVGCPVASTRGRMVCSVGDERTHPVFCVVVWP